MRIINEVKLDFDDVLICPKRSETGSRADVNLNRTFKMRHAKYRGEPLKVNGIPIIAANMDTVGTLAMASALAYNDMFTCLHKFYREEELVIHYQHIFENGQLTIFEKEPISSYAFYTLGISNEDIEKLINVAKKVYIPKICLDVANGYTKYFVDKVKQIRELFPNSVLMVGNVATPDMTQELIMNGADIVKIGIGPGKVCETRKVTGVGYPQLSAIIECADVAHGMGAHICADGGCNTSGDIAKAFGAGADFVMLGTMLAGHDECEGEWNCWANGDKISHKVYGMSSREAMEKHYGGVAEHRAPEGKCIEVPYKGAVSSTIKNILGGLRSACSYVGADDIKHFSKCTTFVRNK